ncbi:hypothetical protein QB910_000049 [Dabrowskivirus KKP3916]|uniref:Uncharacterized protein n=1 Tax=Alicyclobacillus phage KKP_3916 TaxID=3040651 RepID=A0AAT9V7P1_9CAUD|nr:hypothetical protein QB910_000049 [Alicyclobacillus phage KKP 3916]
MGKQIYQHISDEDMQQRQLQYQIQQGLMTSEKYQSLSPEDQAKVEEVLFDMYQSPIPIPQAISGLEFILMSLAKIFIAKDTGQTFTNEMTQFYEQFQSIVAEHEIQLDPTGWYLPYAKDKLEKVKQGRAEYFSQKSSIIDGVSDTSSTTSTTPAS